MSRRWYALLLVAFVVALCGGAPAFAPPAAAQERTVSVAVYQMSPFVIENQGQWTGFTIELWEQIAQRLGWTTNYVSVGDVKNQLDTVAGGKADIAGGGLSITAEREKRFDFSQPILDAGLQIMVPHNEHADSAPGLRSFLNLLWSKSMLIWLSAAALVALIPAHIMWLIERRHPESMVSRSYFPGIFQAFAWGFGALAAVAPGEPQHWVSRSLAIVWGFAGIIFVALYTANLTANLTVEQIESRIAGPDDLYGKSVATVANTTSSDYLQAMGIGFTSLPTIDDCYKALGQGQEAIVFDAPVLRYYATHQGVGKAQMTGIQFHDEDYGLAFRLGSDLRKPIDGALLAIREDGTYQTIYRKWFGSEEHATGDHN
ncbi:polar amino acid transport system substrate-binding protein [Mycolicibacterium sp. BK634]|uniref:transporter substrate-binding domain-containing protein n=1 Tax=Mycolicibacterium sp. BK634 TaxID=2587099 RepID=UPI00161BFCEA|nr:transporter substrate-binding domain-containing protein [Mycolicibacterium sp. BK634]MBB3747856.1 polar amino acid transport system substrate-binding protein [Mycolicibacterium sp. BK634]